MYLQAVEDQRKQVLLNLVQNAIEAMPANGGILTVTCQKDKTSVYVTVQDIGPGVKT